MFDLFYRGKIAAQSGEKGTGIGLGHRARLCGNAAGREGLASAGAHFRVILPMSKFCLKPDGIERAAPLSPRRQPRPRR